MPEFLPFVRQWLAEAFSEAPRAQREGWEAIASGRDTLIVAPTGSGKPLAAFLWALDHLCRLGLHRQLEDRVYVVYLSPLRALNNDIEKNLRAPLAGIRAAAAADGTRLPEVRGAVRTGDTLAAARQAMTRRPPHILITTPESLYILLTSERFRPALASTRFVIVDEVHALMGGKRGAHLALSLERLAALVEAQAPGARPQRIGCSATVSPLDATLDFLARPPPGPGSRPRTASSRASSGRSSPRRPSSSGSTSARSTWSCSSSRPATSPRRSSAWAARAISCPACRRGGSSSPVARSSARQRRSSARSARESSTGP